MSGGLSGASGYSRGPSGASWGLRLLPGALWGLLGPPVTPGGPLGPPGASGYSRGALWGLLGPPVTPRGPSGASWGLPVTPGGPFLPAKPIWRWCGSVRVRCAPGFGREEARSAQALLPVDAGPRGASVGAPRRACDRPWAVPSLNIVKKSGGGLLESALWLRNRAQHVGAVAVRKPFPWLWERESEQGRGCARGKASE